MCRSGKVCFSACAVVQMSALQLSGPSVMSTMSNWPVFEGAACAAAVRGRDRLLRLRLVAEQELALRLGRKLPGLGEHLVIATGRGWPMAERHEPEGDFVLIVA